MYDRIPTPGQEGRMLITPENGAPYYATVAMADNPTQEGTPINKATLWSDSVASMFGLGAESVPNDGFAILGQMTQYWWAKNQGGTVTYVTSTNRNAYPDFGKGNDGATYSYLGIPKENAKISAAPVLLKDITLSEDVNNTFIDVTDIDWELYNYVYIDVKASASSASAANGMRIYRNQTSVNGLDTIYVSYADIPRTDTRIVLFPLKKPDEMIFGGIIVGGTNDFFSESVSNSIDEMNFTATTFIGFGYTDTSYFLLAGSSFKFWGAI